MTVLMVAAGGAAGAVLRWITGRAAAALMGAGFPWGTLFVNVTGSFLMGVLAVTLTERGISERWAPFLLTGMLGGFTTFSAFSLDAMSLMEQGRMQAFAGYVAGNLVLSVAACALGLWLARSFP